jgi:cytidylate kinase
LLREIDLWINDQNGKVIFWLYGAAGTGKSTISRTVAKSLADRRALSASFFFKRGAGDRGNASRFFSTISRDLAEKFPELAPHIAQALESDSRLIEKAVETQYEELILKPLLAVWQKSTTDHKQAVIVIDALDECEEEPRRIRKILDLLSQLKEIQGIDLRIFITSRPDLPVLLGFKHLNSDVHKDVALHDIPEHIVDHDLRAVLTSELENIREDHSIPPPWPSENDLDALVHLLGHLKMILTLLFKSHGLCSSMRLQSGGLYLMQF